MRRLSRLYNRRETFSTSKSLSTSSTVEGTLSSSSERANSERTMVVLSFGKDYRGILSNAKNHPQSFMLPSDNSGSCGFCMSHSKVKCMCEGSGLVTTRFAKPDPKSGFVLYWLDEEVSSNVINNQLDHSTSTISGFSGETLSLSSN